MMKKGRDDDFAIDEAKRFMFATDTNSYLTEFSILTGSAVDEESKAKPKVWLTKMVHTRYGHVLSKDSKVATFLHEICSYMLWRASSVHGQAIKVQLVIPL